SYSLIDNPGGELTIVDVDASGSTYVWFPNLAIDDNIETFWRKKKDNSQWLEVTLSADTDINEVQLSLFDNTSIWPIKIFVNSTEVFNGNSITSANDDLQSYSFSPVNGQTVRVQLNAGSSTDNFGIREIKVIGAGTVINNYLLSVIDGSGSGTYQPSQIISISADAPATGYVFSEWTGDVQYLTDASAQNTTVTMPAADISVSASYAPEEPVSDNITLQAEDADELARANIESTFSDFNGTGYVYLRGTGDWGRIVWNNIELSPGTYSVQVRSQANGSDNASLFVNDTEYALPLPDASDWTYTTVSDITFNATNTLKINNGKQQNIDELIIAVSGNLKKGQILNSSNSSELQSIRVYPNPVSGGTLYLTDYADIKLVNMQGKVLLEKHHVNSVDVSDLQQGIYLLSIGTTFRKIVIE
ncbi:MAG: InlB B-repeat-containing protein, partial [Bacteroidota bacterium]